MFCTRCGIKNPEDALFCSRCGTALIRDQPPVSGREIRARLEEDAVYQHEKKADARPDALPEGTKEGWGIGGSTLAGLLFWILLCAFLGTVFSVMTLWYVLHGNIRSPWMSVALVLSFLLFFIVLQYGQRFLK